MLIEFLSLYFYGIKQGKVIKLFLDYVSETTAKKATLSCY